MSTARLVDLLITDAILLDVFGGAVLRQSLAIDGDRIVGFGDYPAHQTLSLPGKTLLPGFCDGHIHIESSFLTPSEFAASASLHGTTCVVVDPHELANVAGLAGPEYLLRATPAGLVDLNLMAPSCVPATAFETSGATLTADDIAAMLQWPRVLGLGEMMNFPGVLAGDPVALAKLAAAHGRPIDGHAPGLSGPALQAYIAAGPDSDHEATTLAEGQEKLSAGMWLMIREGSSARNLANLAPLLRGDGRHRCLLVSDDLGAQDLLERGHLDHLLREAVRLGVSPLEAVRAVSLNVANRFGLRHRGGLAPGQLADVVAVEDLTDFRVTDVFKSGLPVVREGRLLRPPTRPTLDLTDTVRLPDLQPDSFRISATEATAQVTVITATDGSLLTGRRQLALSAREGALHADLTRDLLKLVVMERHGRNGNIGRGFIQGFGLREGALASTVAHDSHNLIVVGCDDASMLTAARALAQSGGGLAVASGEKVLALLPLPIAGLLSDRPAAEVVTAHRRLKAAAHTLGCPLTSPFATLSFMALPVIPELKLTDRGLFDVSAFALVPLQA